MTLPKVEEYEKYLEDNILGYGLLRLKRYYESVTLIMEKNFEKSSFFKAVNDNLKTYNEEYLMAKGYKLFSSVKPLQLDIKSFGSMIRKCYRKDILSYSDVMGKPFEWESKENWIDPSRCFEKFTDILRTRISVRYLDGAIFVAKKLKALADSMGLKSNLEYKAKEEGYYAIHFDLISNFEVPSIDFDPIEIQTSIEFQVNTEIQNLIIDLAHKYYEERRMCLKNVDDIWQWDFKCDEFVPNYLGHIIHYIEGMIMDVRERK